MSGGGLKLSADTRLRFGIRQKVILTLLFVLIVTLSISGVLAIEYQRRDVFNDIQRKGGDISNYVAKSLAYSVVGYDYHTIQLLLDGISDTEDVIYARVSDAEGKELGSTGLRQPDDVMKLFREPIVLNDQVIGELELGLGIQTALQRLEEQKYEIIKWEALIILIIVIGEFVALSLIIIRPVKRITSTIEDMTGVGECRFPQIALDTRDEFGIMARQFNDLSQCLHDTHTKLKSKIALADEQLVDKNRQLLKQSNELSRINDELRELSITDQLTGLYNRRHFDEHLGKEVALSKRFNQPASLLLIDLDHFKRINDRYGHVTGDQVLRQLAKLFLSRLRSSDVLCRVGGEEFGLLCKHTSRQQALNLAQQLVDSAADYVIHIGDYELQMTLSVGVATIPDPKRESGDKELFACADRALYWSKEHGRNQVKHCQDIDEQDLFNESSSVS